MVEYIELQELFDATVQLPATHAALLFDLESTVNSHMSDIKTVGYTDKLFDDFSRIAAKYDLKYTHPKFKVGLTPVNTGHPISVH